jgi:hypothetical protein
MGTRILMYKENIIYSLVILANLTLAVLLYSGVKEGYFNIFLLAMIIAPIILIVSANNNVKIDLTFTIITVFMIVLYAFIFWKYKDGLLFSTMDITQIPEEYRMQFSFENRLKIKLLFTCSLISALISLLIRFIYSKLKAVK